MFNKYILEIKNRILVIVFSWIFTFFVCYFYKEILLFLIVKSGLMFFKKYSIVFIYTNLTEAFNNYLNLSLFISNLVCFLYFFHHFNSFLLTGLYKNENYLLKYNYYLLILNVFISFFVLNKILLPLIWKFFLSFQYNQLNLSFEAKITEYLIFYKNMFYLLLINNQIFFILFINLNYNFTDNSICNKFNKKFIYMLFFINATLLTSPDVYSQIIFGSVQIIFYELVLFVTIIKNKFLIG